MAEPDDGLELIRQRMERASRRPPPPRRARGGTEGGAATPADVTAAAVGEGASPPPGADPVRGAAPGPAVRRPPAPAPGPAAGRLARRSPAATTRRAAPMRLAADLPSVNLAIRVRRPLDDRLADLIHRLRQDGVRTSKVELIEMLLWELDADPADAVPRLARFRDWAPRGAGAPLGGG